MKNVKKLNNLLLNCLYKGKKVYYSTHNCKIVISDGYFISIVDRSDIYIDLAKCELIENMYEKFIPDDSNYLFTKITNTIELIKGKDIRLLRNENDQIISVDNKYLSLFEDNVLKSNKDIDPVLVYNDDGEIIGLILPIKKY